MKQYSFCFLVPLFFLTGCSTLNVKNITYDAIKNRYEYHSMFRSVELRNEQQQLIDSTNIEAFINETVSRKNRYPFSERIEQADLLKQSDWKLASHFNEIHQSLTIEDYNRVFTRASEIRSIYRDADLYSNLLFLEGYAFEQLGLDNEATKKYDQFLHFSSQPFTDRQRGYETTDYGDSLYIHYRSHASQFLSGNPSGKSLSFDPIPPKHYYNPYQPGFSQRPALSGINNLTIGLLLGRDLSDDVSVGVQYCYPLTKSISLFAQGMFSNDMSVFTVGLPIQVYQSPDNRFSAKFTPFLTCQHIDSLTADGIRHVVNQGFFDFGARLSASYFLMPNLSIGSYFNYYYRNEYNKLRTQSNVALFTRNEFDISLYYGLLKGVSLKAGLKNDNVVVGLFMSGLEISWSLNHPGIILKSDLF